MITGVILARNEEANIVDCVKSLRDHVAEIVLIDMESCDHTAALAQPLVDVYLRHPLIANFDSARNAAIGIAKFDWLWFLDADERVRPATGRLVNQLIRERGSEITAITIPFQTYFGGQWMQHCGWWPGYTMPRVLKRGHFRFAEELHGGVQFTGTELRLPPDPELAIEHFSYRSIEHYVEKFNRYTSTEALNLAKHGARPDWREGLRAMTRDLWSYYERNAGREDGLRGWILSWLAGQYRWFSHAKLNDLPQFQAELVACPVPGDLNEVLTVMEDELSLLRGETRLDRMGLVFRSPLFDPSGYADDGRLLLKAAAQGPRHVTAVELPWSKQVCELPTADQSLFRALLRGKRQRGSIAVTNCIPTLCQPDPAAEVNVLRTTFETDRIPAEWHPRLKAFDEIWVWSQHNLEAFRRSGVPPEKLHVLPGFVDTSLFTPEGPRRELPEACRGRFVFLSVFDWQLRKGWDALLRAYVREFAPTDGTALLLKVSLAHGYTIDRAREQAATLVAEEGQSLNARGDIILWHELLDAQQMANLYRGVDAFVLASRGEGWGRPYMEAMATGLTTIGTRGSGNTDFMNDSNSLLVRTTLVGVSETAANEIGVYRGHRWCEPDIDELRTCLSRAAVESTQLSQLRAQAVHDMRSGYSLEQAQSALEQRLAEVEERRRPISTPPLDSSRVRVALEGEFFAGHSFSNINEQLAVRFARSEAVSLTLNRVVLNPTHDAEVPGAARLLALVGRDLGEPSEVVIRHAFPPNWQPTDGKWVHIQPWEFGRIPRDWVPPLRDEVDEIWAPSEFVKQVYVRSGISATKIQVIPWGIDPAVYSPAAPPLHLPHDDCFRFLFMGGTVERKGFDLLLRAYREEFTADEPVALVIKDVGTQTFYRFGNRREEVLKLIAAGEGPPLVYLEEEMTDGTRASLYTACDCLAAPYRGEGFGLPVLEGMACGLAPIVPRGGATDDFVRDDTGYFVPAHTVECPHGWRMCAPPTELAIDIADLRAALRHAYEHRDETRDRGQRASDFVRREFTWDQSVAKMIERLQVLRIELPKADVSSQVDVGAESTTDHLSSAGRLDLSVCVLTKNHEGTIADCLAAVEGRAREIIVHDLGSTDRTLSIAREFGARITMGVDVEHRGASRNVAIGRATSAWILSLDGDERIEVEGLDQLSEALAKVSPDVLGLRGEVLGSEPIVDQNGWHGEVRVFRNRNDIACECRGLERVTPAIRRIPGGRILDVPFVIRRGVVSADIERLLRARLHRDQLERGRDPESLWGLGVAHARNGDFFHAESYLHDCWLGTPPDHPLHGESLKLLVECYRRIGDDFRASEFAARLKSIPGGAA